MLGEFIAEILNKEIVLTFPIYKSETDENGDVIVYGKATDDTLDQDKQILDKDFMEKAMKDWFEDWGNVRQQHSTSLPPAGKAMGMDVKPDGVYVRAKVVEPVAKELVKAGVYQAYSVGVSNPRIIRDMDAPNGRVVDGVVSEISLVDRPANTNCRLTVAKRKGSKLVTVDDMFVGDTLVALDQRETLVKGAAAMLMKMGESTDDANISSNTTPEETNSMAVSKGAKSTTAGEKPAPLPAEPGDASVSADAGEDDAILKQGPEAGPQMPAVAAPAASPVEETRSDVGGPAMAKGDDMDDDDDSGGDDDDDDDDDDDSLDKGVGAFDGPPAVMGEKKAKKIKKGKKGKQGQVPPDGLDTSVHTDPVLDDDASVDASSGIDGTSKMFPAAVQRLHDATCAAFSDKAVAKAWGADPTTIIRTTGPDVMFTALRNAVAADMGKGAHVGSIVDLTDAYSTAQLMALAAPSTIKEVRTVLHKTFVDDNKDALANSDSMPMPKSAGQPDAGKYKRPLITSGQAKLNAGGGSGDSGARIPSSGDTPDPKNFTSSGITSGQERQSPANKADRGPSFANAASNQAAAAMQALHDHMSYTFPDMCPMGPQAGLSNTPVTGDLRVKTTQKSGPVSVPQSKVEGAASNAVANKVADTSVTKAYTGEVEDDNVQNELRKMAKKLRKAEKVNKALQAELQEYGAQPDPFKAPVRGVMVGSLYGDDDGVLRKSEVEEYAELMRLSGNPDYRLRAEEVLNKINKFSK